MAFIAALLPSIFGSAAAAGTAAAGTAAAGTAAAAAGTAAAAAGTAAAGTAAAGAGFLGTGLSVWQAAGLGFTALSTIGTIMGNTAAATHAQMQIARQLEAGALEAARTRRETERQGSQLTARRLASLAAQGGTGVGGTFDLLAEPMMETSLEGIQRLTDLDIQAGVLRQRSGFVRRGTAMSNIAALGSGAAKVFSLLDR